MADMFPNIYGGAGEADAQAPTFTDTLKSAFNLENDVANLYDWMSEPQKIADMSFNPTQEFDKQKLPTEWLPTLAGAVSKQDFDIKLQKIQQEQKDQAILAASGWTGTVAALGAGILSPTSFIPIAGPYSKGAKFMREAFAFAALGSATSEAALLLNQETRTEAEAAGSVAMGTLLGGLLGGAFHVLSPKEQASLAASVGKKQLTTTVPVTAPDVGEAATKTFYNYGVRNTALDEIRGDIMQSFTPGEILPPGTLNALNDNGAMPEFGALGIKTDEDLQRFVDNPEAFNPTAEQLQGYYAAQKRSTDGVVAYDNEFAVTRLGAINGEIDTLGRRVEEAASEMRILREATGEAPKTPFEVRAFNERTADTNSAVENALVRSFPTPDELRGIYSKLEGLSEIDVEKLMKYSKADEEELIKYLTAVQDEGNAASALRTYLENMVTKHQDELWGNKVRQERLAEITARNQELDDRIKALQDETDMGQMPGVQAIPDSGRAASDLSAAQTSKVANSSGPMRPKGAARNAILDTAGTASPLYRMQTNKISPSLRDAGFKLDDGGLRQANLETMEPSADGGHLVSRISSHDRVLVKALLDLDAAYSRYLFPNIKDPTTLQSFGHQIKSALMMLPTGKASWAEYKARVLDDLTTDTKAVETAEGTATLRKFFDHYNQTHKRYLKELQDRGLDVGPLYKELVEGDFAEGEKAYAHHVPDSTKIMENSADFDKEISDAFRNDMHRSFERSLERVNKKLTRIKDEASYALLPSADKERALFDLESDIADLRDMPEYRDVMEEVRAVSRDEKNGSIDKETAKALRAEIQAAAGETYAGLKKEIADKTRMAGRMRKLGGNADKKLAETQAAIAKIDDQLYGMFQHEIPAIEKIDTSVAKMQNAQSAMFKKATTAVEKGLMQLQKHQAAYKKLMMSKRTNTASRAKVMERIEKSEALYKDMLDNMSAANGKNFSFTDQLSELDKARRIVVRDATELAKSRANRIADLEEKAAVLESKQLTPEEAAKTHADLMREHDDAMQKFESGWYNQGAVGTDLMKGEVDFSEQALREAVDLRRKYTTGDPVPQAVYARQGVRGPQKARMLRIPYATMGKWLNKDAELVMRVFDRAMGPDLEIWRAFDGSVNGDSVLKNMEVDVHELRMAVANAKFVKLPKQWSTKALKFKERVKNRLSYEGNVDDLYLAPHNFANVAGDGMVPLTQEMRQQIEGFITDSLNYGMRDFDIAIKRLRHTRMVPDDTNSLLWRTGRVAKDLNIVTSLNQVVISSVADLARPMFKYGVMRSMKTSWMPFIGNVKSLSGKTYRMASKEINRACVLNTEPLLHGRAQSLLDLGAAHAAGKTKFERGLRFASQKNGIISLLGFWTAGMKSMAGNITHGVLSEYIPRTYRAIADNAPIESVPELLTMRTKLRSLGLRDVDIIRIGQQMEKDGAMEVFSNGGKLPNLDAWDDVDAFTAYSSAIRSDVGNMILQPNLERPNMMDENLAYSMFFQFKSFMAATNSRVIMSGVQGNDPYLFQGVMFSLAFGALSYYLGAVSKGGKAQERMEKLDSQDWIYSSVDRSGLLGLLSYPQKIAEQVPYLNQLPIFGGKDMPYRRGTGMLSAVFGPVGGQFERLTELAKNIDNPDEAAQRKNIDLFRRTFVPYQNHFLFTRALDSVGAAIENALGVGQ